jgi:two-component system LytT family sensor kinase
MTLLRSSIAVATSFLAGLAVGWVDVGASEVQGPLLLLMLAAFAITVASRAPAWLVAMWVVQGLIVGHAIFAHGELEWGILIAVIPALIASYGGQAVATLIRKMSSSLAEMESAAENKTVWHLRSWSTSTLLSAALQACALIGAVPVYATNVARGQPFSWWITIVWQVISFLAWVLATPHVLRAWRALRRDRAAGVTPTELSAHVAIVAGIALLHAVVLPLVTRAMFVPLGPNGMASAMAWALAAYLPLDALTYALAIMLAHASDATAVARKASAREAVVRGELASTRLASLRAQLRPHFLFNALNAATVLTRRGDQESAARVLNQLAELLRYVLADERDSVRLSDELAFADAYLAIERERFPDRLRVGTDVSADARDALVPHLLLQPLVENAVQHGVSARVGEGTVVIRGWRIDDMLHITVENDGPPYVPDSTTNGIGLTNTRARLATIYGDGARLVLEPRAQGGAVAHVTIPYTA